jgi:hypothetical protein
MDKGAAENLDDAFLRAKALIDSARQLPTAALGATR